MLRRWACGRRVGVVHHVHGVLGRRAFAPRDGLFEPKNRVGDAVRKGALAGELHFVEDIDHPPLEVRYGADGVVWMAAGPGRVQRGDCVAVTMTDYDEARAAQP